MRQGYLVNGGPGSIRVRVAGDDAWLNIKSGGLTAVRHEFEYPIPVRDAEELLALLAVGPLVDKTRHFVPLADGLEWEIDEFHGRNSGLIVAELELTREDQPFAKPRWIGAEVTHLARYYNVNLVDHPYDEWSDAERGV
jgi:adenylate cyclase